MKKLGILMIVFALFAGVSLVNAASQLNETDGDAQVTIPVTLDINSTISLTCTDAIDMAAIAGTGTSDFTAIGDPNTATCNVSTNDADGYSLTWQASDAVMTDADGDTIAGLTAGTPVAPAVWPVTATESGWGANVTGTDAVGSFAAADYDAGTAWSAVSAASPVEIATRGTETPGFTGIDTTIIFGAEVGANHWQPTGTYSNVITMTATTL